MFAPASQPSGATLEGQKEMHAIKHRTEDMANWRELEDLEAGSNKCCDLEKDVLL